MYVTAKQQAAVDVDVAVPCACQVDNCGPVHITIGDGGNIEVSKGCKQVGLLAWGYPACFKHHKTAVYRWTGELPRGKVPTLSPLTKL